MADHEVAASRCPVHVFLDGHRLLCLALDHLDAETIPKLLRQRHSFHTAVQAATSRHAL